MNKKTGISGEDERLRKEILKRFVLRPSMLEYVADLRSKGFVTAILSDQTDWLDEIDRKTPFFKGFDYVFNSFYLKKGKRDPSVFRDISIAMGLSPAEIVFIDDKIENIERALSWGMQGIHFKKVEGLKSELNKLIGR